MAPTAADEKLEGMIRDLAGSFTNFQIVSERRNGEIRGDILELRTKVEGDIRALETKVEGSMNTLETRVEGNIKGLGARVEGNIKGLEARVERAFGFQRWLAGFLIPISLGLIGTAVTLAYGAGKLDSSVKELGSRMGKLEEGLKGVFEALRPPTRPAPVSSTVADTSDRVFDCFFKEDLEKEINLALEKKEDDFQGINQYTGEVGRTTARYETFELRNTVDAGIKPGWLTNGMRGLVFLDSRLTVDGIVSVHLNDAEYLNSGDMKNKIHYSVKKSDLKKFKDKISSISSGNDLTFSVAFVRAR